MAQRELRGVLGRNKNFEPGSNRPQYKGSCLINGVEMWISGWLNENENGKFFSLAFEPKEKPQQLASPELQKKYQPAPGSNGRRGAAIDKRLDDDSIPF